MVESQTLEHRLREFLAVINREKLAEQAAQNCEETPAQIALLIDTYLNEAFVGLKLIAPVLEQALEQEKKPRLLEIGSGVGALTAFLNSQGFDIIGIEPGAAAGFGFMPAMSAGLIAQLGAEASPKILSIGAGDLSPKIHGTFDLIFSLNVMEHIFPLDEAVEAMAGVLAENGEMRHSCPNYHFPFEPHLGIPLIPGAPKLTRFLLPGVIRREQRVWDTVNFITASYVRKLARKNGLKVQLEPRIMARFFDRLQTDPIFKARHKGLISKMAGSKVLGGLIGSAIGLIPSTVATPMEITLTNDRQNAGHK